MSDERPLPLRDAAPDYAADRRVSRRYEFRPDYTWEGVPVQRYKADGEDWEGVVRQVLIGFREQTGFHVRYFEIAPGGHSSLEAHEHAHAVTAVRGRGRAVVGEQLWDLDFLDTVYIAPGTPHQFINDGAEPFGFLCVVDAQRDRPRPLTDDELSRLRAHPQVAAALRTRRVAMRRFADG